MGRILNHIIISITLSLLGCCWIQYLTKNNTVALLSAILVLLIYYAVYKYLKTNTIKKKVPKINSYQMLATLATTNSNIIPQMYKYYQYDILEVAHDYIVVASNNVKRIVWLQVHLDTLTADAIARYIVTAQQCNIDNITIIANDKSISASKLLNYHTITVDILSGDKIVQLLDNAKLLPQLIKTKQQKKSIIASYALNKHRSLYYASSAIFLVFISFLSYFPIYTLAWSSILTALAMYSFFNKKYNDSTKITL